MICVNNTKLSWSKIIIWNSSHDTNQWLTELHEIILYYSNSES